MGCTVQAVCSGGPLREPRSSALHCAALRCCPLELERGRLCVDIGEGVGVGVGMG